ncbi:VWA domain-containing protein [Luteolibacter yonseiensis]|uniref:VWA domain-containing protein n=1 Tax=Luteolibacter yonseiensis TaxID=1144680 RepID=A0A934R3A1_9BACT|nr:VWA domain-containing protein [Luteolibacter yonseiensis]MBK1816089.1 VWA domain-containing protein [Luteolibacter yonseiensis]
MNSESPNNPEDRLLDELLREQSHGPDEAFLKQVESAIDAGPRSAATLPPKGNFSRWAIAAGVVLAAGSGFWWWSPDPTPAPQVVSKSNAPKIVSITLPEDGTTSDTMRNDGAAADPLSSGPAVASAAPADDGMSAADRFVEASPVADSSSDLALAADSADAGSPALERAQPAPGMGQPQPPIARQPRARVVPPARGETAKMLQERSAFTTKGEDSVSVEAVSSDRYGTFIDQPWKSPASDPLSTFSIDVDTASYSNVRRMISEGREVPKDAVRIEECINAFKYHYPAPKGDAPFAVGATLADCPWAPGHHLVRMAIKGREIETGKRPASNLVFLIDVSGSMNSPDKLPLLKQSMETMVGQLDERDRVAIVVYAGNEGVALPSTRLDEEGRAKVLAALSNLGAGGSTNGGAGIKLAYEIAKAQKIEGGVNRVILATDGDFNVGLTGQDALVSLVKDRAKSGVYLTVAGFGTGNLNDAMMDAITRDGNGNYFYIDSGREGRKVFLQNLSGTLVTIAKDVKIQVEFNPAKVGRYRLIGYANRVLKNEDFNNDKVDAGDIGAGHTVTAFYEIAPPGEAGTDALKYQAPPEKSAAAPTGEWLTMKLRYKAPDGDESRKIEFPLVGDVRPLANTDKDFQFSTAAALFGMKLRGMDETKDITWGKVRELAKPGLEDDSTEDRAEFVKLVEKLGGGENAAPVQAVANESDSVDGPNVRVIRHQNGTRSILTRNPDGTTIVRKTLSAAGVLTMKATYKLDEKGNPLGCKIVDGQNTELFRVSYGYHKETGKLVDELMFDSRVKRIDPGTGQEMPVQRVTYPYDEAGKRGQPVVLNYFPGQTIEQTLGGQTTYVEPDLFRKPAEAEIIQGN